MDKEIETILDLIKNPHYKLSPKQLQTLEEFRGTLKHSTRIPRHDPTIVKHNPTIQEEQPWKKN